MTASANIPPRLRFDARVVGGRFRLVRQLGEGGMGVVWEVVDESTGQRRAAKFLRDEDRSEMMVRRLLKEAQAISAIRHPNVVRVDEVAVDDDGTPVIVMEFLEGETLGARIERDGLLSVGQTAAILRPVVSALRAAHASSVVHRDLKPDNIFLTIEGASAGVRVLDFGIAKHANVPQDSLSITGTLLGTPLYMSPEQASGERGLDARTDVWSLSVILFECLAGGPPVNGDNFGQVLARLIKQDIPKLAALRPDLPPELSAAIDHGLVPRDLRSADLAPLEATLAALADSQITPPRSASRLPLPMATPASGLHDTVGLATPGPATSPIAAKPNAGSLPTTAFVAVMTAFLGIGLVLGWLGLRDRRTSTPPPPVVATTVPTATGATAATSPTGAAGISAEPSAAPSVRAIASAEIAPSGSASATPPRLNGSALAPPPAAGPNGKKPPKRLQGGVAGDVPF